MWKRLLQVRTWSGSDRILKNTGSRLLLFAILTGHPRLSFCRFSAAASRVSSFLQKQNLTICAPSDES